MRLFNRRSLSLAVLAVLLATVLFRGWHADRRTEPSAPYRIQFEAFGTVGELVLYHDREAAQDAAEATVAKLRELHGRFNRFDPSSEVSRLNEQAYDDGFACSDPLWRILQQACRGHRMTDGAFDITIGPLMDVWGFRAKRDEWPEDAELAEAREAVGLAENVAFEADSRRVRFLHPKTRIDLGGIAKGFALDTAAEMLRRHGMTTGLINLGGNIRALQAPPMKESGYAIGVRNPVEPDAILGQVELENACIATSGSYENVREIDGRRVTHVVDPRTGRPVKNRFGVSVVTPRGVDSDIFSTSVFVGGEEMARRLANAVPRTRFLISEIQDEGQETRTLQVRWQWSAEPERD